MSRRSFRLASLLAIREAAEEQQKRHVATCSRAVTESKGRIDGADSWMKASLRGCSVDESAGVELTFVREALDAVGRAKNLEKERHVRLEGELSCAVKALHEAHQQTETLRTLRSRYLEEMLAERKRQEQAALDEVFRLCNGSAVGMELDGASSH